MTTANQQLLDSTLRHEIGLRRLSTGTVRKLIAVLNDAEADIERQIRQRLGWIADRGFDASPFTLKRLEHNLLEVRAVLREAYAAAGKVLRKDLVGLAGYEVEFQARMLKGVLPPAIAGRLSLGLPTAHELRAIVDSRPFQGGLLRDWARKLEQDSYVRLRGAIRQGMVQGEGIDKIVRRVRGTRAAGWADGILQVSRRQAEAVVRTAVSHVAQRARESLYQGNDDIVKGHLWLSVLDSRTTPFCQVRDGLAYDLDHKPIGHAIPWGGGPGAGHWGCRAVSTPLLRSWSELGIDRKEVDPGTRASMDGQVPASTTYGAWLKSQPAAVQDEVLGPTRGAALRRGDVSFNELFDDRGRFLRLDELRRLEAAA